MYLDDTDYDGDCDGQSINPFVTSSTALSLDDDQSFKIVQDLSQKRLALAMDKPITREGNMKYIPALGIEEDTAKFWLSTGAIVIDELGNENTYYINEFGTTFYCKNYPHWSNTIEV